jgi:hypothetical protein
MTKGQAGQRPSSILPLFLAVLLLPAALGSSQTIFNDGDTSWHIATGRWILDHRAIPHVDPFSFTWAGKPWVPIEWLSEVIYAIGYRVAGYAGVAAVVTAAMIGLHAAVFSNATRFIRPWAALAVVIFLDLALVPIMLARPHVLTWPVLGAWIFVLMRAREQDRAPPLVAALLMTLWANLHGGFVFGLAIAAAFGLEALLTSPDRKRALRQWLIFGAACAVAVFINGNGVEGVFHPLRFTQLEMLPLIDEWKPSDLNRTPYFFLSLVVALGVTAWKRPQLGSVRWILISAFLVLALVQVRHQAMLAIVVAMLLPGGFAQSAGRTDPAMRWVVLGGAAFLVALRAMMPLTPPDNEANPWKLIASVPPGLRSQPVLNSYTMGGPLILSGIRPYVDGRGDMYGDELVIDYYRISQGDPAAFAQAVRRWNIRWVIVGEKSKLIRLLDRSPGWRRIRQDKVGAIYARTAVSA